MPITIKDGHLEEQIDAERINRGDATMAKTTTDLLRERLMELEIASREANRELAKSGKP